MSSARFPKSPIGTKRLRRQVASHEHPGKRSFVEFARHVGPVLSPDFTVTKQLALFAFLVESAIVDGQGWLRLILCWPPGTGKTWTGKLFLAWCFGLHPDWHVLALCLSADLSSDIGADIMRLISSEEFADVFPVALAEDSAAKKHFEVLHKGELSTEDDEQTGAFGESIEQRKGRGEFNAAGRSTRFTGRRGKVIYQDDLLNEKEADSPVANRDAQSTIRASFSRGHPAGYHWIVCNTRYRLDDPIGYILDKYRKAGPWTVVVIPTIVEEGEEQTLPNGWQRPLGDILFPYTADTVAEKKAVYEAEGTIHEWYGQHKGQPVPPTGRKVNSADFMRYEERAHEIRKRCDRVIVSVDTAKRDKEGNDPSAILVWGQHMQRHYLLYACVERLLLPDLLVRLAEICIEWRPFLCLIELTANGEAARDTLQRQGFAIDMSSGRPRQVPWNTSIEGVEVSGSDGNKELRFNAVVPGQVRQGNVWVPPDTEKWSFEFVQELSNFPRVAHDDRCDAAAIYFKWVGEHAVSQHQIAVPTAVAAATQPRGRSGMPNENWSRINVGGFR